MRPPAKPRASAGAQLELTAVVNHRARRPPRGGARPGAGRKPARPRARRNVAHRTRPLHKQRHPVHVTLRARSGLPSLRSELIHQMLRTILVNQRKRRYADSFQVVELSIQDTHVHFIVEANGPEAHRSLRSGISGLAISFAKRLNNILHRRGKVWGDRWHGHELVTPREVRNALVYVFRNVARHGTRMVGDGALDPLSSAPRFTRWTRPLDWPFDQGRWPPATPRTWLLGKGWFDHGGGPIDPDEVKRTG